MNKKILQELIREATTTSFNQDGAGFHTFSKEKFAELIVRECIELNKQELAFNAFERLLNIYKEHFGVEE